MGLFDNVTAAVNRGTESAGRAAEKLKLKNQINEINKRRQQLAAQLGASLYDATKDNVELRSGRETLYAGIASCDKEREACQEKIEELDAAAQAASIASTSLSCAVCGASINAGDLFCSGCGAPAERAIPAGTSPATAEKGPKCSNCGAVIAEDDMFCMSCGAKQNVASDVTEQNEAMGIDESESKEKNGDNDSTASSGGE